MNPTFQGWPAYQWPQGKRAAFCFSVDVDADAPYLWTHRAVTATPSLGQLEQRRFGLRVGIWALLDLLDRFAIKASFFVPAAVAEANPRLLPAFVERGHEIGLHGFFHEIVSQSSDDEFSAALDASLATFLRQTGQRPAGFRSPAWDMTPHMLAELRRQGLYDSSLMGAHHPYSIDGVTEVPVQWQLDDAIHFKFNGDGSDHWRPAAPGPVLDGWLDEWQGLRRMGGLFMLTVHDWISGRAQRLVMLEKLLTQVLADDTTWVATVGEIAQWHAQSDNGQHYQVESVLPPAVDPQRFGEQP
ncbi:MAG TPA: polysaccharide deacetylase [Pseudomonas sp.]|uniref:polysaccharide deacetylase family protein n=1 Tax=Pseudomonas sp. TaxID=306 RepID=UPI002B4A4518|nr:polysaccharide deacetylase [Pseudomonas sp.]HKS13617.1 polysaccharide deacetylase [Pseudomonas sp.]